MHFYISNSVFRCNKFVIPERERVENVRASISLNSRVDTLVIMCYARFIKQFNPLTQMRAFRIPYMRRVVLHVNFAMPRSTRFVNLT